MLWLKYSWVFSLPKSSRGSDQSRSHIGPKAGGSLNRSNFINIYRQNVLGAEVRQWSCSMMLKPFPLTFLMSSKVCISGESPPCTQRNCWFMRAARGRQSNASIHESYTCSEYLILPDRKRNREKREHRFHLATLTYMPRSYT